MGFLPFHGSLYDEWVSRPAWLASWIWLSLNYWLAHSMWLSLEYWLAPLYLGVSSFVARSLPNGFLPYRGSLVISGCLIDEGSLAFHGGSQTMKARF